MNLSLFVWNMTISQKIVNIAIIWIQTQFNYTCQVLDCSSHYVRCHWSYCRVLPEFFTMTLGFTKYNESLLKISLTILHSNVMRRWDMFVSRSIIVIYMLLKYMLCNNSISEISLYFQTRSIFFLPIMILFHANIAQDVANNVQDFVNRKHIGPILYSYLGTKTQTQHV